MHSKVSGLLHHSLSPDAQRAIFLPWIEASFDQSLPLLAQVNQAHVVMLREVGLITAPTAVALLKAIAELATEGKDAFVLDGALEDVYFNYEAELIRRTGQQVGGQLHTARSRNDLQSTLDRMRARAAALKMLEGTLQIRRALLHQARLHVDCVMPGYTHLQHAQPITFGFYLAGVEQSLTRDFDRQCAAFDRINVCPLGAGALAGTTFPIDRSRQAALLGFSRPVPHALDAVASKDTLLELMSAATFTATTFGRLAQDFYLMSTFEFAMLDLPDSLAITSSIMPQKKNQAVLEFLKGRQAHCLGALMTGLSSFRAAPFSHVLDSNADSLHWLWQALDELVETLPVVEQVVRLAVPDAKRMAELAAANFATVTDLADLLVRTQHLSFKEAHHIAGRVVRLAIDRKLSVAEISPDLVSMAAEQTLGRNLSLSREEVADAFDPRAAVARRTSGGGPSALNMDVLLGQAEGQLRQGDAQLAERRRCLEQADQELKAGIFKVGGVEAAPRI